MKLLKLSLLAAAAAVLVVGTGTLARAFEPANNVADGTYVFNATGTDTQLDGSWVTFASDAIVSWNLVDTTSYEWLSSQPDIYGYPSLFPPLTTANSSVIDLLTYNNGTGPNAFNFHIGSPIGASSTNASIFWFGGQNNLNNESSLYDGATFNHTSFDPIGNWNLAGPNSVPDASSTFELFAGALLALGACKSFLRRRA